LKHFKYLINNIKVINLDRWCVDRGFLPDTFYKAIHRKKKKGSNKCECLGYEVIKLEVRDGS